MLFARHSSNGLGAQRPYGISLTAVGEEGEKERKKKAERAKGFPSDRMRRSISEEANKLVHITY